MTDRKLVEAIERAALWAWPPREAAHEDGWLLRAGGAHSRRVNSAQTLVFAQGSDVGRVVERVERWYAARSLPACFQLTALTSPTSLDGFLTGRGYARLTPVSVLLVEAAQLPAPGRTAIELETRPTPLVMNAVCDPRWAPAIRRERAALLGRIRKIHVFAVATEGGQPMAGALCVVDGSLAGIFTLRTAETARRRGLATAVLRRLAAWARHQGAETLYLQVEEGNAASLALCRRHGAVPAYGYWYREQTSAA